MQDTREHPIRLKYSHPGARPPVYVAASFTSPPWQPLELDYVQVSSMNNDLDNMSEFEFFKDFYVTEGHWQYKFRLGPGDWWVCREGVETETDNAGNRNNILVVQPWLTPGSHDKKRAHVRPLARQEFEDVRDTAWEVTAVPDKHKQAAVQTQDRARPEAASINTGASSKTNSETPHPETHSSHGVGGVSNDEEVDQTSAEKVKATELAHSVAVEDKYGEGSLELVADHPKSSSESPSLESSPLFAHECLTPEHKEAEVYLRDDDNTTTAMEEQTGLFDNFVLEEFPSDREHILQRIETTKSRLDEDETSSHGLPSPTFPTQLVVKPSPSSNASSPQLESIEEEESSNKVIAPPLELSDPSQAHERSHHLSGAEASHQYPRSSEDSKHASIGDSDASGYSFVSEEHAPPIAAHNKVLDPGLATLGVQHKSIEEYSSRRGDHHFAPLDVDGPADIDPTSHITQRSKDQSPALSMASEVGRRESVPEEPKAERNRRSSLGQSASANEHNISGVRPTVDDGLRERKAPGDRAVTSTSVTSATGGKHENFFLLFWRVVIVDWFGAMLARLFGRGRGTN